jgi:hypothetical protein
MKKITRKEANENYACSFASVITATLFFLALGMPSVSIEFALSNILSALTIFCLNTLASLFKHKFLTILMIYILFISFGVLQSEIYFLDRDDAEVFLLLLLIPLTLNFLIWIVVTFSRYKTEIE